MLSKYVAGTVGMALIICAAAVAKNAINESQQPIDDGRSERHPAMVSVRPTTGSLGPLAVPAGTAHVAAQVGTDAAHEREMSRAALNQGRTAQAVEAGERSVAADPTDGEAWLILGAAYQQEGDVAGAGRSFRACIQKAKRGPVDECRAMSHGR